MVCSRCEKKLSTSMHIDTWKEGSRHIGEGGGRQLNENKALSAKKRWTPYGSSGSGTGGGKCKICRLSLHQEGIYCQKCAYSKGMCSMCGVKVMDISFYNIGSEEWNAKKKGAAEGGEGEGGDAGGASGSGAGDLLPDDTDGALDATAAAKEAAEEASEAAVLAAKEKETAKQIQAAQITSNRLQGTTTLANAAREMATAATGQAVSGWQYDNASGYYYDVQSQMYFDPKSHNYFIDGKWVQSAAPSASQMATGKQSGSFKSGTRKPDRFGL